MTIYEALRASKSAVAEGKSARGKTEYAMRKTDGIRIIKSPTDPTVVRKLTPHHYRYSGWEPA